MAGGFGAVCGAEGGSGGRSRLHPAVMAPNTDTANANVVANAQFLENRRLFPDSRTREDGLVSLWAAGPHMALLIAQDCK